MTCDEFRQQLLEFGGGSEFPEAAVQHLGSCPACQEQFARDSRKLDLRRLAESEHAPGALRERIEKAAFGEMPVRKGRHQLWRAVAVVIFLGAGWYGLRWYQLEHAPSPERLAEAFVADHLHYLPGREQLIAPSAPEVERWFLGRVDFPVRVPTLPAAALEDARVCTVAGRKAALVHYRHEPDQTLISLFISEAPRTLRRSEDRQPLSVTYQGFNAAVWSKRGLVYSVVAALDEAALKKVIEAARQQQ